MGSSAAFPNHFDSAASAADVLLPREPNLKGGPWLCAQTFDFQGQEINGNGISRILQGGDTMSHSDYLEGTAWVQGEQTEWSPKVKLILAFILGLLALSPATLGIHWEMILANW